MARALLATSLAPQRANLGRCACVASSLCRPRRLSRCRREPRIRFRCRGERGAAQARRRRYPFPAGFDDGLHSPAAAPRMSKTPRSGSRRFCAGSTGSDRCAPRGACPRPGVPPSARARRSPRTVAPPWCSPRRLLHHHDDEPSAWSRPWRAPALASLPHGRTGPSFESPHLLQAPAVAHAACSR